MISRRTRQNDLAAYAFSLYGGGVFDRKTGKEQGDQSGEGGSSNTVPSTKEETSVNPDTADMNIVQLSVLSILFAGIAVLSYKKVIKNNN